jgi:hypothetical protein
MITTTQPFAAPGVIGFLSSAIAPAPIATAGLGSASWATANKARFCVLNLNYPFNLKSFLWVNGGTINGNVDAGIYTIDKKLITSIGSTAQSGGSTRQRGTLTNPVYLKPGSYILAFASSSSTGSVQFQNFSNVAGARTYNCYEQTSAFPLPSTITPVDQTTNFLFPALQMFQLGFPVI